jgi:hypothetical protein
MVFKKKTMKTIYMEDTLKLLEREFVNSLISAGKVKTTEEGINYLLIEDENN